MSSGVNRERNSQKIGKAATALKSTMLKMLSQCCIFHMATWKANNGQQNEDTPIPGTSEHISFRAGEAVQPDEIINSGMRKLS